jgi:hypothetical protein
MILAISIKMLPLPFLSGVCVVTILSACQPQEDLLKESFNPEISPVFGKRLCSQIDEIAELADANNPYPLGKTIHVYTWKTVFSHSVIDRKQGKLAR